MKCPHCGGDIAAPAGVTGRQKDVLDFIRAFIAERGVSPTYSEIGRGVGLKSSARVHFIVYDLAERGHLSVMKARARSIALVTP